MALAKIPLEDDDPWQSDPNAPIPFLQDPGGAPPQGGKLAPMLAQDPGPVPDLKTMPRIGDDTPLGRFAQPILPAPPEPQVETYGQADRNSQRADLDADREKRTAPHLGQPGSSHPGWGGKILHGLSVAGNIAGNFLDPNLMAITPGTQLYNSAKLNQDNERRRVLDSADQEEAQSIAQLQKTNLENAALPTAQSDAHARSAAATRLAGDQADQLENPAPEFEFHDTAEGPMFVNKATGQAQHVSANGHPIGPKIQTKTVQLQVGGKPHQVLVNDADGSLIKDLGESGEKPPTVNVNQGEAALDREVRQFGGGHQKALDASNAQLEKIADARSMISGNAEAQSLGVPKVLTALVGGQGTGVRITQAELDAIAHARGMSGDVEGTLNKMNGKGALSRAQQQQLLQIMDDVKNRIVEKQAIARGAVDAISGASTRNEILAADKQARENLANFERFGIYAGKQIKLKNGTTVTVQHVHPDGSFD